MYSIYYSRFKDPDLTITLLEQCKLLGIKSLKPIIKYKIEELETDIYGILDLIKKIILSNIFFFIESFYYFSW